MEKRAAERCFFFWIFLLMVFCNINAEYKLSKKWLHDQVPEQKPEIFAPGIISTDGIEFSPSISVDLKTFYYVISNEDYSEFKIVRRKITEKGFGGPKIVSLKRTRQFSPFPTKNRLYYAEGSVKNNSSDIFFKEIIDGSYSTAVKLPGNINTEFAEGFLSVSERSTICFESNRKGGFGGTDIYLAHLQENGKYVVANAGPIINSSLQESDPFIAPDESYMIVTIYNKPDGFGQADLYLSFKVNGKFTKLINMGPDVNSKGLEHNPHMSPDGKIFFFSSDGKRGTDFDILWVSGELITRLRPKDNSQLQ